MDIITLIDDYVRGLLAAEENFLEHLDTLSTFEETVSDLSNRTAAEFIGIQCRPDNQGKQRPEEGVCCSKKSYNRY